MIDSYITKNKDKITSHKLQEFMRCPFCFKKKHIELVESPIAGTQDHFIVGQAFDDLITDKEKYLSSYEVVARRGTETGRTQLTKGQGDLITSMEQGYRKNPFFSPTLKKKVLEGEVLGVQVRAELDHFIEEEHIIVDLKTTKSLLTFDPMRYQYQMSFYHLLMEELEDRRCSVRLYVVEKDQDIPRSECYEFTQDTLKEGRREIINNLEQYRVALANDFFPPTEDRYTLLTSCEYYGVEGHGIQQNIITV